MRGSGDLSSQMGNQPRQVRAGRGPTNPDDVGQPSQGQFPFANKPTYDPRYMNQETSSPGDINMSGFPVHPDNTNSIADVGIMTHGVTAENNQRENFDQSTAPLLHGNEALLQMLGSPLALQGVLTGGQLLQLPAFMGGGAQNPTTHFNPAQLQLFAQASFNQQQQHQQQLGSSSQGGANFQSMNVFPQQSGLDSSYPQSIQSFSMGNMPGDNSNNNFVTQGQNEGYSTTATHPRTDRQPQDNSSSSDRKLSATPATKKAKFSTAEPSIQNQTPEQSTNNKPIQKGIDVGSGRIADRRYNNPASSMSLVASARSEDQSSQRLAGIRPTPMYLSCDDESLSDYQCFLRQQIELFEATNEDLQLNAQKMNKSVVLGQVGIRCRHCAKKPPWTRARGAVYYSATLDGLYQAGQNMSKNHLCNHCTSIPDHLKQELINLKDSKRRAGGGKQYWSEAARALGVYEDQYGLRFRDPSSRSKQS